MVTVSQIPSVQDLSLFRGETKTFALSTGTSLSGRSIYTCATSGGDPYEEWAFAATVTNAATGAVSVTIDYQQSTRISEIINSGGRVSWSLFSVGGGGDTRTHIQGTVSIKREQDLGGASDRVDVRMVAGDKLVFDVDAGIDLTGVSLVAYAASEAIRGSDGVLYDGVTRPLAVAVPSPATGVATITVDYADSAELFYGATASGAPVWWRLQTFGSSYTVLKAGAIYLTSRCEGGLEAAESFGSQTL